MLRLQLSEPLLGLNQENEAGDEEEVLGRELLCVGSQESGVAFLAQLTRHLRSCENTEVSACRKSEFLLLESVETWKRLEI